MPVKNPLVIPEILVQVGTYLSPEDLPSCLRVSKHWMDVFIPLRWRVVRVVGMALDDQYRKGPHAADIYRYRHLIHDLTLCGDPAGLDKYSYPNLQSLTVEYHPNAKDLEQVINLDATETFPSLVELSLHCARVSVTSWLALSGLHHLRTLNLCEIVIKTDEVPGFWKACANVERLCLLRVAIREGIPPTMTLDRMRKLELRSVLELAYIRQLELMLQCPNLEDLHWRAGGFNRMWSSPMFDHVISRGAWPQLRKLAVNWFLSTSSLSAIIGGAGDGSATLVQLRLSRLLVQPEVFKALSLHSSTLAHIDIGISPLNSSVVIRDILCYCPRLETLKAGVAYAGDITGGGPWVCQLLRELDLSIWFRGLEQELQQLVYGRISTLTRLERLGLYYPNRMTPDGEGSILEFRLDRGLAQLASLQQLMDLRFLAGNESYVARVGMEEIEWIVTNWKKLKSIHGTLDSDPDVDTELKEALRCHDIDVV